MILSEFTIYWPCPYIRESQQVSAQVKSASSWDINQTKNAKRENNTGISQYCSQTLWKDKGGARSLSARHLCLKSRKRQFWFSLKGLRMWRWRWCPWEKKPAERVWQSFCNAKDMHWIIFHSLNAFATIIYLFFRFTFIFSVSDLHMAEKKI